MPSAPISSVPSEIFVNPPLGVVIQNTGVSNVFIGIDNTVAANNQNIFIAPNVSFEWPAQTPLWAVCSLGQQSMLSFIINGATIGSAAPSVPSTAAQYLPAANPHTLYVSNYPQAVGIYAVTCPLTTVANILFYDTNNTLLASGSTSAGVLNINVPSNAAYVQYYTDSGLAIQIVLQLTGTHLPFIPGNFTLDLSALDGENILV